MRTIVFETMCEAWAFEREIELIALLKTHCGLSGHWGANLTNGGEGASGAIRSDETRKRMSDAHRGHHRSHVTSEVTRQRLRQVMCGDGNPMFGRTLSAESREKIRVALQGEENPNFGKPLADEVRRKIADALRGKKRRPFTDEHRRKLSLARKRRANFVEVTSPS